MMLFSWIRSRINHALIPLLVKYNSRNGVFAVEIKSCVGLGARLEWCLEILAYCDENGLIPQFKFSYPTSRNSDDYFGTFLEIKRTVDKGKRPMFVQISSITELNLGKDYDRELSIHLANVLINKYLIIKHDVLSEVEDFCSKYFGNGKVLGVHYRGTDKVEESSALSYDRMTRNITHYLTLHPDTKGVFIASDDMNYIEHMRTAALGCPMFYRDDSFRARDGKSIHKSAASASRTCLGLVTRIGATGRGEDRHMGLRAIKALLTLSLLAMSAAAGAKSDDYNLSPPSDWCERRNSLPPSRVCRRKSTSR